MKNKSINNICKLCNKKAELRNSHLTPKFVISWLKKTSVTGYLRQAINPNLRKEDMNKKYLFCNDCEQLLGKYESQFAKKIFFPFVEKELNEWGSQTGNIPTFNYEEWLLKFIISLQFRHLITVEADTKIKIGEYRYNLLLK